MRGRGTGCRGGAPGVMEGHRMRGRGTGSSGGAPDAEEGHRMWGRGTGWAVFQGCLPSSFEFAREKME